MLAKNFLYLIQYVSNRILCHVFDKLHNFFYTDTFNIQLWVLIFYHNFHIHTIQYTTSHHYNIVYTLDQSITLTYITFTPHFKGKRRCISGIIALLSVLRNALTRNGDSTYSYIPPRSDITCICTIFTPQIKGKPVYIYHILHWFRKVNEIYALRISR